MSEIRDCSVCLGGDPIPGVKCCFNCAIDSDTCKVGHTCGKDCPGWTAKTNADQIRTMNDEELAALLCFTRWAGCTTQKCLEWIKQPVKDFIK